ncbi:hypothetical protein K1719_030772 [Acacia pycnantha]|nr:hypothetical protein K1719_030772 [Acacia pycnantha]
MTLRAHQGMVEQALFLGNRLRRMRIRLEGPRIPFRECNLALQNCRIEKNYYHLDVQVGYFIVSFSNKEDKEYAFQEGPWMIEDHYLIVQRWRPNFNPWKADMQCNIAAWIRLPDVPFEFYNIESLRRIGNMVGRMIKIDRSTSIYEKGGFARICVEIDPKKPLLPTYVVFGEERDIIYEGLHQVCFECGKYGHQKKGCPMRQSRIRIIRTISKIRIQCRDGVESKPEKEVSVDNRPRIISGDKDDVEKPFGKIRLLRREVRGAMNSDGKRKHFNEPLHQAEKQDLTGTKVNSQRMKTRSEIIPEKAVMKRDVVNAGGPVKNEWIQVGSKRKNSIKGVSKGKENKIPTRQKPARGIHVGPVLETINSNQFSALRAVESPLMNSTCGPCVEPKINNGSPCVDYAQDVTPMVHNQGMGSVISQGTKEDATSGKDISILAHQSIDELMSDCG